MPQQKKAHVREAILLAARQQLAEHGLAGASLAAIAAAAQTSIGNLYKYFADKDALLAAAIPAELGQQIRELLRAQVQALGGARDIATLPPDHPYRAAAVQTRAFSIAHRHALLYLLRHGELDDGERFADAVAADFVRLSADYVRRAYPELGLGAAERRALRRIYRGWVAAIADILAEEQSDRALALATERHAAFHLGGLRAFFAQLTTATTQESP